MPGGGDFGSFTLTARVEPRHSPPRGDPLGAPPSRSAHHRMFSGGVPGPRTSGIFCDPERSPRPVGSHLMMTSKRAGLRGTGPWSLILALATIAAAFVPSRAGAAQASLSCPGTVAAGGQFMTELVIDVGTTPLGAYGVTLTYDPAVLTIASVAG